MQLSFTLRIVRPVRLFRFCAVAEKKVTRVSSTTRRFITVIRCEFGERASRTVVEQTKEDCCVSFFRVCWDRSYDNTTTKRERYHGQPTILGRQRRQSTQRGSVHADDGFVGAEQIGIGRALQAQRVSESSFVHHVCWSHRDGSQSKDDPCILLA